LWNDDPFFKPYNLSDSRKYVVAFVLNAVLIAGSILMPLTHYVWMASSDHFEISASHHVAEISSHASEGAVSESSIGITPHTQIICDYSTTLAESPAAELQSPCWTLIPRTAVLDDRISEEEVAQGPSNLRPPFRGPPTTA